MQGAGIAAGCTLCLLTTRFVCSPPAKWSACAPTAITNCRALHPSLQVTPDQYLNTEPFMDKIKVGRRLLASRAMQNLIPMLGQPALAAF